MKFIVYPMVCSGCVFNNRVISFRSGYPLWSGAGTTKPCIARHCKPLLWALLTARHRQALQATARHGCVRCATHRIAHSFIGDRSRPPRHAGRTSRMKYGSPHNSLALIHTPERDGERTHERVLGWVERVVGAEGLEVEWVGGERRG